MRIHHALRAASGYESESESESGITSPTHPDLIAMYTMDNISGFTLVDETSNGNDADISGAISVTGKIGDALDFDGIDDYVTSVAYPGSEINELSVSFWIKFNSLPSGDAEEMSFCHRFESFGSGANANSGIFIEITDLFTSGSVRFWCGHLVKNNETVTDSNGFNAGSRYQITTLSTASLVTGQWYFVTYVLGNSGKTSTLYLDGAEEGSVTSTQTIQYSTDGELEGEQIMNVLIDGSRVNFADGLQDQFRFFDRVLTPSEISELYNGGAGA